ncbi:MAG: hypothetical protein WCW30_01415 [Candidatus Gracilibacteria bacterium]|jgi:hypothetical protein
MAEKFYLGDWITDTADKVWKPIALGVFLGGGILLSYREWGHQEDFLNAIAHGSLQEASERMLTIIEAAPYEKIEAVSALNDSSTRKLNLGQTSLFCIQNKPGTNGECNLHTPDATFSFSYRLKEEGTPQIAYLSLDENGRQLTMKFPEGDPIIFDVRTTVQKVFTALEDQQKEGYFSLQTPLPLPTESETAAH